MSFNKNPKNLEIRFLEFEHIWKDDLHYTMICDEKDVTVGKCWKKLLLFFYLFIGIIL